jgi:hypothetical protein
MNPLKGAGHVTIRRDQHDACWEQEYRAVQFGEIRPVFVPVQSGYGHRGVDGLVIGQLGPGDGSRPPLSTTGLTEASA